MGTTSDLSTTTARSDFLSLKKTTSTTYWLSGASRRWRNSRPQVSFHKPDFHPIVTQPPYVPPYANFFPQTINSNNYSPELERRYSNNLQPIFSTPQPWPTTYGPPEPLIPWSSESPVHQPAYPPVFPPGMGVQALSRANSDEILTEDSINFFKTEF